MERNSPRHIKNPLISIITPVYNVERFIKECAESVLNQTYDNFEWIPVDDCSTDNSKKILENLGVKVISHEKNKGPSAAYNTGIDNSKGEYVLFLDGDDYLDPVALEIEMDTLLETDSDFVFSEYTIIDEYGKMLGYWGAKEQTFEECLKDKRIPNGACLTKRSLIGNTRFDEGLRYAADYDFLLNILKKRPKIKMIDFPVYYYRIRQGQDRGNPQELVCRKLVQERHK